MGRGENLDRFVEEMLNPVLPWLDQPVPSGGGQDLPRGIGRMATPPAAGDSLADSGNEPLGCRTCTSGGWRKNGQLLRLSMARGPWWNAGAPHMNEAYPKRYFDQLGLVSLLHEVRRQRVNAT